MCLLNDNTVTVTCVKVMVNIACDMTMQWLLPVWRWWWI